jgi:hypothetical protein
MDAVRWWAPILNLESFVDQISIYIAESNDKEMDKDDGAQCLIESSRRTADIRIKRNVVEIFKADYPHNKYSAEEIVEMTVIHELVHIFTHPMSEWAHSTIGSLRNVKVLESLFAKEEEVCVEHLTRVLFGLKEDIKVPGKYKGKIVYLTKDPWTTEDIQGMKDKRHICG